MMKKLFTLLLATVAMTSLWAADFEVDSIAYNITDSANLSVSVTSTSVKYSGKIVIPDTVTWRNNAYVVTAIADHAFDGCSELTSVVLGNYISSIGAYAFNQCSNLSLVVLGERVSVIRTWAFSECTKLSTITIPSSVTSIENAAFFDNELTSIVCKPSNPPYCHYFAFILGASATIYVSQENYNSYKKATGWGDIFDDIQIINPINISYTSTNKLDLPLFDVPIYSHTFADGIGTITFCDTLKSLPDCAFSNCHTLSSITLPDGLQSIGQETFLYCKNLVSIHIPRSVESIGKKAFQMCYALKKIQIPNTVTNLESMTFYCCDALQTITFSDSLETIGGANFWNCGLRELLLPSTVKNIGWAAFFNCGGLSSITCKAVVPPTCDNASFRSVPTTTPLYVPEGSVEAYKKAIAWKDFMNIQAIGGIFDPSHPLNPGKYNVSATAFPIEGGTISGTGEYAQGATAQLTATANTGYTFIGWSDGETSATRSFTMPAHDTAFVANFKINSYLITFNNYDGTLLQSDSLTYGSTPQFKGKTPTKPATAQWTYTFKEWTPAIAQVTGDATYTATFDSTLVSYLVTFNNYDGTQLQSSNVNYGTMPQYTGTTPEKPSTKHWSYTFKTWNPQVVAVTQAATYTATYDSTLIALDTVIVTDEQNISDLQVGDITHVIVKETGKLTVDEPTEALSLTLYQTNTASAQVVNVSNLTVASADMVLRLEPKAEKATLAKWYAFGVPFEVEVASGIAKEGASSKAQSGYDFVIDNYDGALRATTQQGWKRCQTSDVLQQGKFYMIAVNGTQNLWRFTKKASAAIAEQTSLTVNQNTATSANHSGWNGLSNSLLQSAMASMQGLTYATIYRNATSTYETILLTQSALDASHPFFVQVAKSGTILLSEATTNAPARMLAATTMDDNPIYTIAFQNKDYTDKAYLSLSETKANEYTIGLDVEKMQANTTSQPQLWLEAYGMQLAAHEARVEENAITTIPMGLYAPADGEFTLTTTTTTTTTFALLNKGSEVEPTTIDEEANTATWTLYLTKGTNNNYALQIGQRGIGTSLNHYPLPTTHYTKFIQNGTLYIKRDGKMYNAQGGEVK